MRFCFDDKVYICFAVTARGMTVAAFRDRNREVSQMICFQILLDLSHHTHTRVHSHLIVDKFTPKSHIYKYDYK